MRVTQSQPSATRCLAAVALFSGVLGRSSYSSPSFLLASLTRSVPRVGSQRVAWPLPLLSSAFASFSRSLTAHTFGGLAVLLPHQCLVPTFGIYSTPGSST